MLDDATAAQADVTKLTRIIRAIFGTDDLDAIIETVEKSCWFPLTARLLRGKAPIVSVLNEPGDGCVPAGADTRFEISTNRSDLGHEATVYDAKTGDKVWSGAVDMTTSPPSFTIPGGTLSPGGEYYIEFEVDSNWYVSGCVFRTCEVTVTARVKRWLRRLLGFRW